MGRDENMGDDPMKIGLKLYSTDVSLIPEAGSLAGKFFDFIELYIVPGSHYGTISAWKSFHVPFIIHAPHTFHGVNLAQAERWEINRQHLDETKLFADDLSSGVIIVHGGNNGSFKETLRQLLLLNDRRIVLENKPKLGLFDEECVGSLPSEIRLALEKGAVSATVLDFVHACCSARSHGIEASILISEFLALNPRVFHISDGEAQSEKDSHLNFGKGSLDISGFLSVIPDGGCVTLETPRDISKGLGDFVSDVIFLRKVSSNIIGGRDIRRGREEGPAHA
jgi:deoxyribonuclease-4